ncbi:hypothetical protein ACFC1R_29740 [Kitasatospora sp. NPDC056138]|uniref:hypothetical protein n=1 Tax=Kitasatospora sp. NPDC056138 TaxID=3345724 RepID=UPI0035DEEC73
MEEPHLVDALIYCDMTTPTTAPARIVEIVGRYGPDSIVGRFIRGAEPDIHAATQRVENGLSGAVTA